MSVFYKSLRIGKNGKPFYLYKFRTMIQDAEYFNGPTTSENDWRLTKVGKFLRKYKLDELPNLFNVLRGDMSLVGPRPYTPGDLEDLRENIRGKLLSIKPGMTDYASLIFHNEAEIVQGYRDPHAAYLRLIKPAKLKWGLIYIHTKSWRVDLWILRQTILLVLQKILGRV